VGRLLARTLELRRIADQCGYPGIEMIVDEWGASENGFAGTDACPPMSFRDTEYFAAFFAKLIDTYTRRGANVSKLMLCLSGQHGHTRDFQGYRSFFTLNRFPNPIYNAYALAARLGEELLDFGGGADGITNGSTDGHIGVFPTRTADGGLAVMLYRANEDLHKSIGSAEATLNIRGLSGKYIQRHWRIDRATSNSRAKWLELGSPENPSQQERETVLRAGRLNLLYPERALILAGAYREDVVMASNSVSLIELAPVT
jgi:xylan 1,4-beta-xylosidase